MKKILIIVGTRPEAIKLIPVYFALNQTFDAQLVSTGQHREMLAQVFEFFQVTPRCSLDVMTRNQALADTSAALLVEMNKVFEKEKADMVIVQGDTTSAMVAALVAYYHKIPVAHVEAGLRSHNIHAPFPEEVNRRIISQVAYLNFAPTMQAAENLSGCRNVHVVGNTIVDSLHLALQRMGDGRRYSERFSFVREDKDMVLVTAHRRESFGRGIENICQAIKTLAVTYPSVQFVFPVHLNPNIKDIVYGYLDGIESVALIGPVNYDEMIYLMKKARIILTDSGGIQEEAPSLGVPLIVMRDVTERPEGIAAGCAVLGGTSTDGIVRTFKEVYGDVNKYNSMRAAVNPYGDGQSATRIEAIIRSKL